MGMAGGERIEGVREFRDAISGLYERNAGAIKTIARRYMKLNRAFEFDDFMNEAYLAAADAYMKFEAGKKTKYGHGNGKGLKLHQYFYWFVQKRFQKLCRLNDSFVIVSCPGEEDVVMAYSKFLKRKRKFKKGTRWTVVNRLSSLNFRVNNKGEELIDFIPDNDN